MSKVNIDLIEYGSRKIKGAEGLTESEKFNCMQLEEEQELSCND